MTGVTTTRDAASSPHLATPLSVAGAWVFDRASGDGADGTVFDGALLHAVSGVELRVRQLNTSVSGRGVVRGVHWVHGRPEQVKYVFCPVGRVLDMVVDLRRDSPSFLASATVELSGPEGRGVLIPPGVGHCFLSLEEGSVLSYLSSCSYDPLRERTVDAFDPVLALPLGPSTDYVLSSRDRTAPRVGDLDDAALPRFSLPTT